jgi:AbiV family abortive infection protein
MSKSVTAQYLLEGAVYSLERCGELLRDANLLHRNRSYATAVALAAFAREELGRWRILLELRKKVVGGEQLTVEEVQARCEDHVTKQKAGMLSLGLGGDRDSGVEKLIMHHIKSAPGSDEQKAAGKQLDEVGRRKEKRVPDDRHRQRMSALYVDVSPQGWNRPSRAISEVTARDSINDAVNDYYGQYERYTDLELSFKYDEPDLYKACVEWSGRPELPRPERPA